MDALSLAEVQDQFVRRTQLYTMKEYQYLPAANFKLHCADYRKLNPMFPKFLWQMFQEG
jgi:hypothetical protein